MSALLPCHAVQQILSWRLWILAALALGLAGCGGMAPTTYVHPNYDFSRVKRVAVLPLDNLSTDQMAGEKMRVVIMTELLSTGIVDVVELGQVNRALTQLNIQNIRGMSPDEFKRVAAAVAAQMVVIGSVESFDRVQVGGVQAPEVTLTLRGLEAESGLIVWATSVTEGGATFSARLFGLTGDSLSEVARRAAHDAVVTLFR